jgi:energy-coupling factor transport system ATP-binding protein
MDHIEIKHLTYRYPSSKRDILTDISLNIKKGEFCAIIGPNGGGKTTLCHAIRGFVPHFYQGDMQGEVWIDGKNTREMSVGELALKVGFVFQNPFTQISGIADTVYEELAFGLENLGVEPAEIRERIERVLKLTRLDKLRDRTPFELSGGQQQRVALASIIVMEPEILVIDEPTSQLDPEGTEEVFEIIRLMKESGKTIVLVEHKMELVAQYSDRVVLIDEGRIILDGRKEEVLTDTAVLQHNTALPQYSLLGLEMKKKGMALSRIPITESMAHEEVSRLLKVANEGKADSSSVVH